MDQELFANWFKNHFLQHAVSSRPLLLMFDGHSSHYTLDLIQSAADNDVVIFCLPHHTTADTQPLDTSCFGPLKAYWSEACRDFMFKNSGKVVSKFQFSKLFSGAWSKGMTISNITMGFHNTGIYPFNCDALLRKLPTPSEVCASDTSSSDDEDEVPNDLSGDPIVAQCESSQSTDITHSHNDFLPVFAPERIEVFKTRLENGFNVYDDSDYVSWLQFYHPESAPALSVAAAFSCVSLLQSVSQSKNNLASENSSNLRPPNTAGSSLSSPAVSTPQALPNSYLLDTGSCKCIQFVVYFVWCFFMFSGGYNAYIYTYTHAYIHCAYRCQLVW